MATETDYLREAIAAQGGSCDDLPDNLQSTLYKKLIETCQLPFGKTEGWVPVLTDHFPAQQNNSYVITDSAIMSIKAGETYKITYGGEDFVCTAIGGINFGGIPVVGLGNMVAIGGPDTGEPVCIMAYPMPMGPNMYGTIAYIRTAATPAFSIQHHAQVITQLPLEYAPPLDWDAAEGQPGYIKNRTHYGTLVAGDALVNAAITTDTSTTFPATGAEMFMGDTISAPFVPSVGDVVFVSIGGTQYECTVMSGPSNATVIGNMSYVDGSEDTGEPFLVVLPSGTVYTTQQLNAVQFVIATAAVSVEKQLDPAYIPDNSCYLTSPNGTRYQLTVADDGTLSATAVE